MKKYFILLFVLISQVLTGQTVEFEYTGSMQTFTVPENVIEVKIEAWGAQGGDILNHYPIEGGKGGYAEGYLRVSPGQTLNIFVGGKGADRNGNHPYGSCEYVEGGWNGGGANRSRGNGTPGGGASDVRVGGTDLASRIIVAGGGGGGGWTYAKGGDGGGLIGSNGTSSNQSGTGAYGGTQDAGGAAGTAGGGCGKTAGSLGQGGDGSGNSAGGGGGGGGYYGGGGGGFSNGGGGGSSYIDGVVDGSTEPGLREGNGFVQITVTKENTAIEYEYTGDVQTFTAPSDGEYLFELWGAQGGSGGYYSNINYSSTGGFGGYAKGKYFLNAGETVYLYVGGQGEGFPTPTTKMQNNGPKLGGWNGGGTSLKTGAPGTGGGGASDIRVGGTELSDRVIVAGGGGGGGNAGNETQLSNGGAGGGLQGVTMPNSTQFGNRTPGTGATQSTGHSLGIGQDASQNLSGGGGGGYYGGTAGANSTGGGGGSSYIAEVTDGETDTGVREGNGFIKITLPIPVIALSKNEMRFTGLYAGETLNDTVIIYNKGGDTLFITDYIIDTNVFTTTFTKDTIIGGDSIEMVVTFSPAVDGAYSGTLTIENNDWKQIVILEGVTGPALDVSEEEFNITINQCFDSITESLRLRNIGKDSLFFRVYSQVSNFDETKAGGNTNSPLNNPIYGYSGIAVDSHYIHALDRYRYRRYDINTGQEIVEKYLGYEQRSIVVEGDTVWIGNNSGQIRKYDLDGNYLNQSIPTPFNNRLALAFDGEFFYTCQYYTYNPTIYKIDKQGNVIKTYSTIGLNEYIITFVWVKEHADGHLWCNTNSGRLAQFIEQENSFVKVRSFYRPSLASGYYNIGHDGNKFYNVNNGNYLITFEDGYNEGNKWINFSNEIDSIPEDEFVDIDVEFNAKHLKAGSHSAEIVVQSNDKSNTKKLIACNLLVEGDPELAMSTIDHSFGNIFIYGSKTDTIFIKNIGCDTLFIQNIVENSNYFELINASDTVLPQDSVKLIITFLPESITYYSTTITIETNDVNQNVDLEGWGIASPEFSVDTNMVESEVTICHDITSSQYTIFNTGNGDLAYNTTLEVLGFDGTQAGKVLDYRYNMYIYMGSVIVEDVIYGTQGNNLYWYNYETGNSISSRPIHNNARSMTFDGTHIWIGDNLGNILAYNLDGSFANKQVKLPYSNYSALAFDGANILVAPHSSYPTFYAINKFGDIIETYSSNLNYTLRDMVWVPNHGEGKLWVSNSSSQIKQLQLSNNSFTVVRSIDEPVQFYDYNIEHDGTNLVNANSNGSVRIFNDGIHESKLWLNISSLSNTVTANNNEIIDIDFTAEHLNVGEYRANLIISSDDPLNPLDTIECIFRVYGDPVLILSDKTLTYGDVPVNGVKTDTVIINNTGCDTLELTNISITKDSYTLSHTEATILPKDSLYLYVSFEPYGEGTFNATLTIESNDADSTVNVTGRAVAAPEFSIQTDTMRSTIVECGGTSIEQIRIRNNGDGSLSYSYEYRTNDANGPTMGNNITNYNTVDCDRGLVWANEFLFTTNSNRLYKYDSNFNLIAQYNIHSNAYNITFDGTHLWIGNNIGQVIRYDKNGNATGEVIQMSYSGYSSLTWDGEHLLIAQRQWNPTIYWVTTEGDIVDSKYMRSNTYVYTIEWVNVHGIGNIWTVDNYGKIKQFYFNENNNRYEVLNDFNTPATGYYGLDHHNNNLWFASYYTGVHVVDDGITEPSVWLGLPDPVIVGGNLTKILNSEVNAGDLNDGTYSGDVIIHTNDPLNPSDTVHVELTVDGEPEVVASSDSHDFGNIWVFNNDNWTLTITNEGCDTLVVDSIRISLTDYSVDIENFTLLPGEEQDIDVEFTPEDKGDRDAVLTIYSNTEDKTIDLTGYGLVAEVTTTSTTPSNDQVNDGQLVRLYVNFNNNIDVGTSTGTPRIELNTEPVAYANYFSGSGSTQLEFRYYVSSSENSLELDYTTINALELNGGSITYLGVDANIDLPAPGTMNSGLVIDNIAPNLSLSANNVHFNTASKQITIKADEFINGFTLGDIDVTNGNASSFVTITPGIEFTVNITPLSEGDVLVNINNNVCIDLAANSNNAAETLVLDYDITGPTPTLSHSGALTNSNPISVTVDFGEPVTGLDPSDFVVGNGNATAVNSLGSGDKYVVSVVPSADGLVTIDLPGTTAQDLAGNNSFAASQLALTYDSEAPVVTISSKTASPTNINPIKISVHFSEEIIGLALTDFKVGNGSADNLIVVEKGFFYTVDILTVTPGTVTVELPQGSVYDEAKNGNIASNVFTIESTSKSPTAILTSTSGTITNDNPINVTLQFNEAVTGFELSDVQLSAGTLSGLQEITNDTKYSFNISPSGEGILFVDLPAHVVTNATGNGNTKAEQLAIAYDITKPDVVLSSNTESVTNISSANVTIQFSEVVSGFTIDDISVVNATASNFATVKSGERYTFDLTPTNEGEVKASINGDVATDAAGNNNNASDDLVFTYDNTSPSASISSNAANITNVSKIKATISFNETVSNFTVDDIVVTNAALSGFGGSGSSYSVYVSPSGNGTVSLSVKANAASDAAGNLNIASDSYSFTFDKQEPTVSLSSDVSSVTSSSTVSISIAFNEVVTGFELADITVENGTASNLVNTSKNSTFTADITPTSEGTVIVKISDNIATDEAGNNNKFSNNLSFIYDASDPIVKLSSSSKNLTNLNPIPVTIKFNEAVSGFEIDDITCTNGTAGNFTEVEAGVEYTVDVTPTDEGDVVIDIVDAAAADAAGNTTSSAQLSRTYDSTSPIASISTTTTSPINSGTIDVSIEFDEAVVGFTKDHVYSTNGEKGSFTVISEGTQFSLSIKPINDGTVLIYVADGVVLDAAGNENVGSSSISIEFDATAPKILDVELLETTDNSAQFIIVGDEDGTAYYLVKEIESPEPSVSNVISGSGGAASGSVSLNSNEEVNLNASGLEANTRYTLYVVTEDALGNNSKIFKASFETDKTIDITSVIFNNISVFPNPNNGKFQIDFGGIDITNGKLEIRTLAGKLIAELDIVSDKQTIEMVDQQQGIYIIQIQLGEHVVNKRFVLE